MARKKLHLFSTAWVFLIIHGVLQEACAALCPKIDFEEAYGMFKWAETMNFTREKTLFEKFLGLFMDVKVPKEAEEITVTVNQVEIGGQTYIMVSKDDFSRMKDGGKRTVFGGGGQPNTEDTSFSPYSPHFRGAHCSYALAYGPNNPEPAPEMLRFILYIKDKNTSPIKK